MRVQSRPSRAGIFVGGKVGVVRFMAIITISERLHVRIRNASPLRNCSKKYGKCPWSSWPTTLVFPTSPSPKLAANPASLSLAWPWPTGAKSEKKLQPKPKLPQVEGNVRFQVLDHDTSLAATGTDLNSPIVRGTVEAPYQLTEPHALVSQWLKSAKTSKLMDGYLD